MSLLFAALFIAAGIAIYWGVGQWKERRTRAAAAPGISLETPGAAAGETPKPHPYQKFIEVTGVRLLQTEKKSIEARFLVVNHSPANIADMTATVTLRARGVDENEGAITFNVPSLGGYESREITAPVQTRLRVYELPDWQNLETQVRITAP